MDCVYIGDTVKQHFCAPYEVIVKVQSQYFATNTTEYIHGENETGTYYYIINITLLYDVEVLRIKLLIYFYYNN